MPIKPAGFLIAKATQGTNDAFAETTIVTGLSLIGNLAYEIRGIAWTHTKLLAVDAVDLTISLTRRTKSAIATLVDPDVIFYQGTNVELATSGAFYANYTGYWKPLGPTYVVEDNLYLGIDSTSTSATNSVTIRIEYDIVRVTDSERNALLSRTVLTTAQT